MIYFYISSNNTFIAILLRNISTFPQDLCAMMEKLMFVYLDFPQMPFSIRFSLVCNATHSFRSWHELVLLENTADFLFIHSHFLICILDAHFWENSQHFPNRSHRWAKRKEFSSKISFLVSCTTPFFITILFHSFLFFSFRLIVSKQIRNIL